MSDIPCVSHFTDKLIEQSNEIDRLTTELAELRERTR